MRTILIALMFVGFVSAAPAPQVRLPKPINPWVKGLCPRDMVGEWTMFWGGGQWNMKLTSNGDYIAHTKSNNYWVGTWYFQDNELFITESMIDSDGKRCNPNICRIRFRKRENGMYHRLNIIGDFVDSDGGLKKSPTYQQIKK